MKTIMIKFITVRFTVKAKQAVFFIMLSVAFFIVAAIFIGINISKVRKYESDYVRVTATITGLRTEHISTDGSRRHVMYYTYYLNGNSYEARENYYKLIDPYKIYVGTQVEIYVDPNSPNEATRLDSADLFSLVSIVPFFLGLVLYSIGAGLIISKSNKPFLKRQLFIWLPLTILCIAIMLICWLGLPNDGFGEVFSHMRGAIGYAVFAGATVAAAAIDFYIHLKRKNNSDG